MVRYSGWHWRGFIYRRCGYKIRSTIAAIGDLKDFNADNEIDATGMVVASWFYQYAQLGGDALMEDGRSQSDIRQGVTLEIFGEGRSMGHGARR